MKYLLCIILFAACTAKSNDSKPVDNTALNGINFKGIQLGQDISTLDSLKLATGESAPPVEEYWLSNSDFLKSGDKVEFDRMLLRAYQGKIFSVVLYSDDIITYSTLVQILPDKYGIFENLTGNSMIWQNNRIQATLSDYQSMYIYSFQDKIVEKQVEGINQSTMEKDL